MADPGPVSPCGSGTDARRSRWGRRVSPNPFVTQVYARNMDTKKPWVSAIPSSHIWVARLPADLGPGTHRADIEVVDEYGRTRREAMIVEVTGA
jgi:hypothetical protein